MKKLLALSLLIPLLSGAGEMVLATDKATALKACQEKAANSPKSLQAEMLSFCQCVVEKTDFEAVEKLSQAGNTQALQALYQQANQDCANNSAD